MNKEVKSALESEFSNEKIFITHIRTNIALAKAQEKGMDIFTYNKRSNGAIDYSDLTKEFLLKLKLKT